MFQKIQLQDFQCHQKLRIKFDSQITCIVGESDCGKSAVIRALRWLTTNRPRGDGFIREGQEQASVYLKVDGHDVRRSKGNGKNEYVIDRSPLQAFGTDVPEQVEQILNLGEENYSSQHDPPFWFNLTAGELAKQLNRIVDLGLIDDAAKSIASKLRKSTAEVEVSEDRLGKAEAEEKRLEFVTPLSEDMEGLQEAQSDYASRMASAADLGAMVERAKVYGERADRLRVAALDGIAAVSEGKKLELLVERIRCRSWLLETIRETQEKAGQPIPDMTDLTSLRESADNRAEGVEVIKGLVSRVNSLRFSISDTKYELTRAKERFERETEGVCPICGNELEVTK